MHSGFESSKTADFADKNAEKAFLGSTWLQKSTKTGCKKQDFRESSNGKPIIKIDFTDANNDVAKKNGGVNLKWRGVNRKQSKD